MNINALFTCLAALTLAIHASIRLEASSIVQDKAAQLRTISGSINKEAKYYAYLQSASWCGPCQQEMPKIARQYQAMKAAGMEVILCSHDSNAQKAKDFLKKHGAEFPAVMAKDAKGLPGFEQPSGIPYAIVVDSNGKVLKKGHGAILESWQSIINEKTSEQTGEQNSGNAGNNSSSCGNNTSGADDDTLCENNCSAAMQAEDTVAGALKKASVFNGEANEQAMYYIYLYASGSCCGSQMVMPRVASLYPAMRGSKVELIYFSCDKTSQEAKQFLKNNQATFPATMATGNENFFPGHLTGNISLPYAVIVDPKGAVIYKDHAAFLENWQSFIPAGGADGQ